MAEDDREDEPRERRRFWFGEQLTGLLDPEAAFRRGHGLVTGVTQATKEELMRIVSSEVRSFLDKMDAADLLQQIIAGLVVDVQMQIRFSKAENGPPQPEITRAETSFRTGKAEHPDEKSRTSGSGAGERSHSKGADPKGADPKGADPRPGGPSEADDDDEP